MLGGGGLAEMSPSPGSWRTMLQKWQQMSMPKKLSAGVLAAAVLLTLFYSAQIITRPKMTALFTGLEAADAGRITGKLQEMGVAYTLGQEGRTILVEEDKVYDLRIQLASDGTLLGGSAGFELFDQTKLGATDFNRRLDYQRALQEELRRTIVQLEEVEQARVHLALPEPSVFIEESAEPSASIVLRLSPFSSLSKQQVQGIMHLVAGSVENLKPEQVTIVDTQGNMLSGADLGDSSQQVADATGKQLEVRRSFEQELEQRVQRLLDRVFGPGQAIAMLTAELDFDSRESTVITFATEGVPRSQTIVREKMVGTGDAVPAEAGTDSNIPGYEVSETSGEVVYEKEDETINYEVNETTEKQIVAPGRLLRLHTAIILNDKGDRVSQEQIAQIQETVAAAVGYQEDRGDSINVSGISFDTSHLDEAQAEFAQAEQQARTEKYITIGVIFLAGILFLIFGLRFIHNWRIRAAENQPALRPMVPVIDDSPMLEENMSPEHKLRQRVRQLADKEPEAAAFLIRAWLTEE